MESFFSGLRHTGEEDLEMKNLDNYASETLIKSTWEKGEIKVTEVMERRKLWIMNWKTADGEAYIFHKGTQNEKQCLEK